MNILFFQELIDPNTGGIQRVSYNVAQELKKYSIKSFLVHTITDSYNDKIHNYESVTYIPFNNNTEENIVEFCKKKSINIIINQHQLNRFSVQILSNIKQHINIKIFTFCHMSPTNTRDSFAHKDIRFPKDCVRSILKQFIFTFYKYDKYLFRYIIDRSDMFVILSDRLIDPLLKLVDKDIDKEKLVSIPNFVTYPTHITNEEFFQKEKIVLVVSRINEIQKRLSRVLDAWSKVYSTMPEWRLVIVGDGNRLNRYKHLVKKMNLQNIYFEGPQDPLNYYKKASLFLMTSIAEGFGMTILEAEQNGVVPICYDSFLSLHDLVIDGYNGYIIENDNKIRFVDKMLRVMKDDHLRGSLALNAISHTEKFSKDIIIRKWLSLLEK